MSQSFRLFHVPNLSVLNFRIFLLMYPRAVTGAEPLGPGDVRGAQQTAISPLYPSGVIRGAAKIGAPFRGSAPGRVAVLFPKNRTRNGFLDLEN